MNPFGIDPDLPPPAPSPVRVYPRQTAWSYSAVTSHARCPLAFRFRRIDRYPEPSTPALDRGSDMHASMAHYLTTGELPERAVIELFQPWFPLLDDLRNRGATPEQQVAFTRNWERTEWYAKDVFLRVVFDAVVMGDDVNNTVHVYEWKTGKRYDDHMKQMRLYCFAALKLRPEAEAAVCTIGYLDEGAAKMPSLSCHRSVEKDLEQEFSDFARHFLADDIYPATPGRHCNWCHFRKSNAGPCAHS